MRANVTINVMGTKEDVEKLWDVLCEPNEYGGAGIKLDRNSIRLVEGTTFPLWEAKGEAEKMPEFNEREWDKFKNLYADFPALSIRLSVFPDDGDGVCYGGGNGQCDMSGKCKQEINTDELELMDFAIWKTLKYVPETIIKTEAMCLEAVKRSGQALEYVPDEFKTVELCLKAVKQWGSTLEFVPEELKTAEMCFEAVGRDGWPPALKFVPEEFKTAELCLFAVRRDGMALEFVPAKFKTAELCLEAMKQCASQAFEFVPDKLKTAVELAAEEAASIEKPAKVFSKDTPSSEIGEY
jgi:hypothetical protein